MKHILPAIVALASGLAHAAPGNDFFAHRAELFAGPVVQASNVGATLDPGEVVPAGFSHAGYQASVWWRWKPVAGGWYEITTAGSSIETVLSVWTSNGSSLSLVHASGQAIQFLADSSTDYQIAVAGCGATGSLSLCARYVPDPFARVVASSFEQAAVDVTNGAAGGKATLTIEASREVVEGSFTIIDPSGLTLASVPFSAANRVSGCVARGTYEIAFSLPRYISGGGCTWNVSLGNKAFGKAASQGLGALSPLAEQSDSTLTVVNNGIIDGYALWAAAGGSGSLSSLVGGTGSLEGALSLGVFAFGLDGSAPLRVAGGALVSPGSAVVGTEVDTAGGKHLRVQFTRRLNSAHLGLRYSVQFSSDLIDWETSAASEEFLGTDGVFEAVAVADIFSTEEAPRRFARVLVERAFAQ